MAWRRSLIVTGIVILLIWLLAYGFTRDPRYIPSPLIGRQAPSFTLTLFNGGTVKLEELRGKAVLINFWASWCPPCRVEAPTLEAAWKAYKDKGVTFVGVNIQDNERDALAFIDKFGITYLNGRDPTGQISINYGVWGIPETFFIDRDGRITYKQVGAVEWPMITVKLSEALQGTVSAKEGRGSYQSVR